jgi:hypothetical protein
MSGPFSPAETYVHFDPGGTATAYDANAQFRERLASGALPQAAFTPSPRVKARSTSHAHPVRHTHE